MRWYKPGYGDKKIVTKFALFPITIGKETRWLEKVTVEMEYGITMWYNVKFVDNKKIKKEEDEKTKFAWDYDGYR